MTTKRLEREPTQAMLDAACKTAVWWDDFTWTHAEAIWNVMYDAAHDQLAASPHLSQMPVYIGPAGSSMKNPPTIHHGVGGAVADPNVPLGGACDCHSCAPPPSADLIARLRIALDDEVNGFPIDPLMHVAGRELLREAAAALEASAAREAAKAAEIANITEELRCVCENDMATNDYRKMEKARADRLAALLRIWRKIYNGKGTPQLEADTDAALREGEGEANAKP